MIVPFSPGLILVGISIIETLRDSRRPRANCPAIVSLKDLSPQNGHSTTISVTMGAFGRNIQISTKSSLQAEQQMINFVPSSMNSDALYSASSLEREFVPVSSIFLLSPEYDRPLLHEQDRSHVVQE